MYPAIPPRIIIRIGLCFPHWVAAKAAPNKTQLFQSTKLSGVTRSMAADAMSPNTTGFIPERAASNHLFFLNCL